MTCYKICKKINDTRRKQGQRFQLEYIILAILCGAEGYKDIERFIDIHFKKLSGKFRLKWQKRPAYTTIRNIILGINKDSLEKAFREFTEILLKNDIQISMDGKGRAIDNLFIERFWKSYKYENVFLKNYAKILGTKHRKNSG